MQRSIWFFLVLAQGCQLPTARVGDAEGEVNEGSDENTTQAAKIGAGRVFTDFRPPTSRPFPGKGGGTGGDAEGEDPAGEDPAGEDTETSSSLVFSPVTFAETDAQKRSVLASDSVLIDGEEFEIGYTTVLRSGDSPDGDGTFGRIYDEDGKSTGSTANSVDFASLLVVGDNLFSVTHLESAPGALYLTELHQDRETGELSAVSTENIDLSAWGGIWKPCAGVVTPWGTHLGNEEHQPDAREFDEADSAGDLDGDVVDFLEYMGLDDGDSLSKIRDAFNPYLYGYATEVAVSEAGEPSVVKHMALGRISGEVSYVMPDLRTVYRTEDETNGSFYMFIADEAGDLSAGTLYAMKWYQTSGEDGGSADLGWVELGHTSNDEALALVEGGVTFSDIFETAEPDTGEDEMCPSGFTTINAGPWGEPECLKLRDGMELAAAALETLRYAAMLGATTELRKGEGLTYDEDNFTLYTSISEIARGMEDSTKSKYDQGGPNDIQLDENVCGAIYALDVAPDADIGSDYVAHTWRAVLLGDPTDYSSSSPYDGNVCNVDGISGPDNIAFMTGYSTLIIGEDSTEHQNDVLWAYNIDSGELTRILSSPYGAEVSSAYWYPDINGWGYLRANVQHPFTGDDSDKLEDEDEKHAYEGYLGPFPAGR